MTERPITVAVLNRNFARSAGGAESYSVSLVEGLVSRTLPSGEPEFDVHVFAQTVGNRLPRVTYHTVPGWFRKPRWINQLWYALYTWWKNRSGYDVVHSHENTWHGDIQTVHVRPVRFHLFEGRTGVRRALRWLKIMSSPRLLFYVGVESARHAPRPGRVVVAVSEAMREQTVAAFPGCGPEVPIIHPGVSEPNIALSQESARKQLGLPQGVRVALFVGNDYARKGLRALLEALRALASPEVLQPGGGQAPLHLAIVGDTSQLPRFRQQADELGISERVHFLGKVQEMALAYRSADILVHPTLADSFAMVVLEAMSYGLPAVVSSSKHCGISALLRHGENAVIIDDPHDAQALAQEISRVLGTPHLCAQLSKGGREFASSHDWSHAVGAYAALLRRAAALGAP